MTSLVLLGDQPSSVELANLLERLPGAASGLSALAASQKHAQLLEQGVFAPQAQAALLQASEDEVVAALTLSFAVLAALPSAAEASAAAGKLAALLTSEPQQRAALKIRTLTHLINVVGQMSTVTAAQRFALLLQLLEFALAATPYGAAAASSTANHAAASSSAVSPAALVLQPVSSLKAQIREWKLSSTDATALLLANYRLAQRVATSGVQQRKSKGDDSASVPITYNLGQQPSGQQDYLFALLQSLDTAQPAALREKQNAELALQAALQSAANGIASTLHQLDPVNVFQLAAVQALSPASGNKDAASLAAFELLRILVDADLPAWVSFQKGAGAAFLKEHSATLDAEVLLRRVRVLALAALAVEQQGNGQGDNVITYAALAKRLQLPADDNDAVESAVIDAVMAGRIDAKMDGDAQTLVVKRVSGGVPLSLYTGPNSQAAWAALGQRLAVWRENIHSVLSTLSAQHQQAQGEEIEDLQ